MNDIFRRKVLRAVGWPRHRITEKNRSLRTVQKDKLRVLIAGGYGYCNVGDEAQLAANLDQWRKRSPECRIAVLTPNPEYTCKVHGTLRTELAPRLALFSNDSRPYYGSEKTFKRMFWPVAGLCLLNAYLTRAGLPVIALTTRQARLLEELNNTDVLFLSGGGYLTGMTLSRLWDNMLLIRLAYVLGVPTILSGQTIGIFRDPASRSLARWGLSVAERIGLRDHEDSPKDLEAIGIPKEKITATFDDALFFSAASSEIVRDVIAQSGMDSKRPFMVVNAHFWKQKENDSRIIVDEVARLLDCIQTEFGLQIALLAMHPTDEKALDKIAGRMKTTCFKPDHHYEPAVTVGLVQQSRFCLTMKHHPIIFAMAAGIPTVSLSFDDYYRHKNRGAMKIFGQQDCALLCRPDKLYEEAWPVSSRLLNNATSVSAAINDRLQPLRPFAGEVIKRWLSEFNASSTRENGTCR